jgi:hypothetical protein
MGKGMSLNAGDKKYPKGKMNATALMMLVVMRRTSSDGTSSLVALCSGGSTAVTLHAIGAVPCLPFLDSLGRNGYIFHSFCNVFAYYITVGRTN